MNSTRRILRFFLICIVAQGRVSKATNIYISRASGNDSWSCVQTKPCKTIWRGVSLASDRDAIYLDGTNTDQDPYSCHSTQHLGVYINKRLALIGTGPMPPQIRCSEGTRLTFDGSENTHQMNVTLSGLLVRESFIFFQDTSASIHGCKFVGSKQGVQFVIRRKMVSDFLITNSAFDRNEECISVFVNGTKIESPIIQKKYLLVLSIDNVSFSNCSGTYGSLSFVKVEENPLEGVIDIGNSHFISNVGGAIVIKSLANEMHSNISVMIRGSTFANNRVEQEGGIIFITRKLENSVVLENTIIKSNRGGGIEVRRSSLLKVLSCTFANNTGSAVSIVDVGILEINDTLFVKNDISFGPYGAVLFITTGRNCEYINIKYTTFRGNVAEKDDVAVIIFECNCTTEIRNSYFLDNFTQLFVEETSTLLIQDSIFNQTLNMKYPSSPSLIEIVNLGNLVLSNTTVATEAYSRDKVLMRVNSGNKVSLGNDSFPTKFICPFGSKITIDCYGGSPSFDPDSCTDYIDARITAIKFKCSACEGDSYSLQGGKANGAQVVSSVKCHRCPFGANCSQNIVAKHNFWGFKEERNSSLLRFTMCPVGYCNKTTEADFPEFNSCQGNRNRSGQLCGKCKVNYTETLYSTQCIPLHWCNDYWFWPVALIYVSLLALYLTFRPSVVPWIKRQILWFKENERVSQEVYFDKGYLKILFYFYQVANLFLVSGSSQMLIKDKIVEPIVGIFNFKSTYVGVSICPFPGLTPVNKRFLLTSHIVCTWLMICTLYGVLCGFQRLRGKGKPSPGPYVGGILQTTLLGYTMLASTSLSLLRCVDIGGERRLFFDGNIVCFQWWQHLLIGIACGYVVPFVFVLLWGSIKFYGGTLSVRKLLSACFLPLPFLIYWSYMFLHDKIKGAVAENAPPSSDSRRYLEMVLYDSFKRPEEGSKLSLCWESVMIGRRLILVALKSFVSDPLSRVIVMNLVSVLFLIHHTFALPFRDGIANIIETISLAFIVVLGSVNVFFASFVSLGVSIDDTHFRNSWFVLHVVELVILCLVPACFFLLVLLAVVSQLCRVIVVGFQVLYNVLNSFSACWKNQTEERRLLVAVVGQAHS